MSDEEINKLWEKFKELLLSTKRKNIENMISWLEDSDFRYAPASSQYHSAFRGGLLKHWINVYNCMQDFKVWIDFMEIPEDTIIITSLLHDVCKVDCYIESTRNVKDENGNWKTVPYYQYDELLPWGHGQKSVILILQQGVYLNNTEISMIVNHMGYTQNDDPRRVGKLFRICPQSNLLHQADIEATTIMESYDGPKRFREKLNCKGKNITECLELLNKPKYINIDNVDYKIAGDDEEVDGIKIIWLNYNGNKIKVYAPYSDGLPF